MYIWAEGWQDYGKAALTTCPASQTGGGVGFLARTFYSAVLTNLKPCPSLLLVVKTEVEGNYFSKPYLRS